MKILLILQDELQRITTEKDNLNYDLTYVSKQGHHC